VYGQKFTVIVLTKGQAFLATVMILRLLPVNFIRQSWNNNTSLTNMFFFKPNSGVDMAAYKGNITKKRDIEEDKKQVKLLIFFINVFSVLI
jgi:putative ABC transport system permease protein